GKANDDAARARGVRGAETGKERQHDDDNDVLNEEDADRDLPVERLKLVLLVEELHYDGRAAERECRRDEHGLHHIEPQRDAKPESDDGGERRLSEPCRDRYLADLANAA